MVGHRRAAEEVGVLREGSRRCQRPANAAYLVRIFWVNKDLFVLFEPRIHRTESHLEQTFKFRGS